ncbi:MAG: glycosyltransferase [Oceanipulchritudo sp.]
MMCLLDKSSGAAISVRSILRILASAGWSAHSISASLFDNGDGDPMQALLPDKVDRDKAVGKYVSLQRDGITDHILITRDSRSQFLRQQEADNLGKLAVQKLREIKPDIVISYGGRDLGRFLRQMAKKTGARVLFYLANDAYSDVEDFEEVDQVLCPSAFLSQYYRDKLGLQPHALPTIVHPEMLSEDFSEPRHQEVHGGFITMINPSFAKGGTLFFRLVEIALSKRPDFTFLAVEGRQTRTDWIQQGLRPEKLSNLWWIPRQTQMSRVWEKSTVLIMPSFWQEAAGRVIVEAQLCGIPVLASRRGGIPEQLNGAGFLFNLPEACHQDWTHQPGKEDVLPWLKQLEELADSKVSYQKAQANALHAAEPFLPQRRFRDVLQYFGNLLSQEPPTCPTGK